MVFQFSEYAFCESHTQFNNIVLYTQYMYIYFVYDCCWLQHLYFGFIAPLFIGG